MLSVAFSRNDERKKSKTLTDSRSFKNQTYPYLEENSLPEHPDRNPKTLYIFEFWTRNIHYPIAIKSNCYQIARLSYYRLMRNQKSLKYVTFSHDRILTKVIAR